MNREILENATNQLSTANAAMCKAIDEVVKELADSGKKVILLDSKIDCATCDLLIQLEYDTDEKCVYAVSECEDYIDLSDLTANELFEICNHLMLGNYQLADAE